MFDSRMLDMFEEFLATRTEPERKPRYPSRARSESPIIDAKWIDRTHPRIPAVTLSLSSWPSGVDKLSLADSNFPRWSETFRAVLTFSPPLIFHIEPCEHDFYAKPDPAEEPFAYANWIGNDAAVVAFAKLQMTPQERDVYEAHTTAAALWTAITARHQVKRGVVGQVTLIQQLLSYTLVPGDDHAQKIQEMVVLNNRLWKMGPLTKDGFLCIALLSAMGTHYQDLRLRVMENLSKSTKANPYRSEDILKLFKLKAASKKDGARAASATWL